MSNTKRMSLSNERKSRPSPAKSALLKASTYLKPDKAPINLNLNSCIIEAGAAAENQTGTDITQLRETDFYDKKLYEHSMTSHSDTNEKKKSTERVDEQRAKDVVSCSTVFSDKQSFI